MEKRRSDQSLYWCPPRSPGSTWILQTAAVAFMTNIKDPSSRSAGVSDLRVSRLKQYHGWISITAESGTYLFHFFFFFSSKHPNGTRFNCNLAPRTAALCLLRSHESEQNLCSMNHDFSSQCVGGVGWVGITHPTNATQTSEAPEFSGTAFACPWKHWHFRLFEAVCKQSGLKVFRQVAAVDLQRPASDKAGFLIIRY